MFKHWSVRGLGGLCTCFSPVYPESQGVVDLLLKVIIFMSLPPSLSFFLAVLTWLKSFWHPYSQTWASVIGVSK